MNFEQYCEAIRAEFTRLGIPEAGNVDPECWRDSFENEDSPKEAVDTELSYWGD